MKQGKVEFWAGDGLNRLRIVETSDKERTLYMVNQAGRKTWPLKFQRLEDLHQKIHSGEVPLMAYEIDKLIPTWGNYITGLLKHLGCDRFQA